jgi:ABC-type antimicrobial peptide transport system permease subunit
VKGLRISLELLREALLALSSNRLRSALSVTGIAIGIAAVMTVSAVSSGGRVFVIKELETFGLRSVWVYRDYADKDPHRRVRRGSGIDEQDLGVLDGPCCPAVSRFSPVVLGKGRPVVQAGNRYSNAVVKGVGTHFSAINNDRLRLGRGLRTDDVRGRRPVALIGETVARDLFPGAINPVGRSLRIDGRKHRVVAVLGYKSRDLLASIGSEGGEDANNRILIPYTLAQQRNGNREISYLQAEARSLAGAERAVSQIKGVLQRRHRGAYRYEKVTLASYLETVDRILAGIAAMGVVAASTSLLVGAIGVAGIMSTAVIERTREIGVRMALGARRRHIMTQFLAEAVLISLSGGLLGLIVGLAAGGLMDLAVGFSLVPTAGGILVGLMVSVLVGLASGYFPARRAARLRPVQALSHE